MILPRQTYEALEPGEYAATVVKVESQEGQYGVQLHWSFRLVAPGSDCDGRLLSAWCSPTFTAKSKLGRWARALLGANLDDAPALDTALLGGRSCRLVVGVVPGADGERNKVTEVLGPRRAAPLAPEGETLPALPAAPAMIGAGVAVAASGSRFSGPPEAILWGYEQGVFVNPAAATAAYNEVKVRARPATAAAMWEAWTVHVDALRGQQQGGDVDAIPF